MTDIDSGADAQSPSGRRILILDTSIRILFPSIMVLAVYFVFSGHNRPGGGFVGGLVVGGALALRYVSGGAAAVRSTFRVPAHVILGTGLFLAAGTALVPVLLGGAILEHGDVEIDLPVFGHVKLTSALAFDLGVDFVVIGLILMAFAAFGEDVADTPDAGDAGHVAGIDAPAATVGRRPGRVER